MNVSPFKSQDLELLEVQPAQVRELELARSVAVDLARAQAYTIRRGNVVLAVGGVTSLERDVGYLWSLVSVHAARHFVRLTKIARRICEVSGKARILADSAADFPQGFRWLELLGFTPLDREGDRQFFVKVLPS